MPTFETTPRFTQDFKRLSTEQRARFQKVVTEQFVPDLEEGQFRPGLRVKGVQVAAGVFEMSWAPNSRVTWQYGSQQRPGDPHVICRRVGTHAIFDPGPP